MKMVFWAVAGALALAATGAGGAERLYFEGRMMDATNTAPRTAGRAAMSFGGGYSEEVPTDTNGYLSVYAPAPAFGKDDRDVFVEAAVKLDGSETRLAPRMRLGSAPMAIHADEAEQVIADVIAPGGEGRLAFGPLKADDVATGRLTLSGATTVSSLSGVEHLYVGGLRLGPETSGNAFLSPLLSDSNRISETFNKNNFDYFVGTGGHNYVSGNGAATHSHTVEEDGFAWVVVVSSRSRSSMNNGCRALVTIKTYGLPANTSVTYASEVDCRTNDEKNPDETSPGKCAGRGYTFLVPVRRGETLEVELKTEKSGVYWITAYCGVKMFFFGTR